jgi:hypothetical protein
MKRQFRKLRLFLITAPLAVAIPVPEDSSYIQFSGAAGGGTYLQVIEGCDGSNIATTGVGNYTDAGAAFEFRDHNGVMVGARGGVFEHDGGSELEYEEGVAGEERGYWVNPYVGGDSRRVGFRVGLVHSEGRIDPNGGDWENNTPSVFIRIGNRQTVYWTGSLGESFPIYSGGGYGLYTGFGGRPAKRLGVWMGAGIGLPYDEDTLGLLLQTETQLFPGLYLDLTGRIDTHESTDQAGIAVGLTWRHYR